MFPDAASQDVGWSIGARMYTGACDVNYLQRTPHSLCGPLSVASPRAQARLIRPGLLRSVSLTALLVASASPARAAPFRSLAQGLGGPARLPLTAAASGGGTAAMQAAQLGARNLSAAAQKFASMAQSLALQAAQARQGAGGPADGWLVTGGLQPAAGYQTAGSGVFQGASAPTLPAGATNVTIVQTAPKAILNWQSFNVGRHTTVTFDQSAGGAAASSWSVLNRIDSPSTTPTEIFGAVHAQGQVWVLNLNGVLFGAGAQVSLHSLVAGGFSTTDSQYLTRGLYAAGKQAPFTAGLGAVTVQPGASIVTAAPASPTDGGGSVILLGASAENDGSIATPAGQTILGAGGSFLLRQGYTASSAGGGAVTGNTSSTVLGSEIAVTQGGAATNTGLIQATTGDVTMAGQTLTQAGIVAVTTAIDQRGTIHLLTPQTDRAASVTLAPGSVTAITPDPGSGQALGSAQASKYASQTAYAGETLLNDQSPLPDQPGYARIEITTGGTVSFQGQSLTLAPGGQVAVTAGRRVFASGGAQLDVSGLTGITLPLAQDLLSVNIQGAQLADSPLNRDTGLLSSNTVQIDSRTLVEVPASAADPQNRDYTAGGLLQVTGELSALNTTLPQWLTVGGRITLNSPELVAQPGSVFNIAGGAVAYQGGLVPQTYLIGPAGVLYNIDTAPGNLSYSGIYHGDVVDHRRWNVVDTYANPLLAPASIAESGYTVGRDGGSLLLQTPTAVFEGTINAGVQTGAQQVAARPAAVSDPFQLTQQTAPLAGSLTLESAANGAPVTAPTEVTIGAGASSVAASLTAGAALPAGLRNTAVFGAQQLAGLGALTIAVGPASVTDRNAGSIDVAAPLSLADGGALSLAAPVVSLGAGITVRGGSLTVQTEDPLTQAAFSTVDRGTITLAPGAVLDTRGTWTNALLDPSAPPSLATIDGGDVTLRSTGTLELGAGSLIDASAGGLFTVAARLQGGHGGAVTLIGDDPAFDYGASSSRRQRAEQPVVLDGTVRSLGVTAGGSFTLDAPSVVIGGAPPADPTQVALAGAFFGSGFGGYAINGFGPGGVAVLPGTTLDVTEPLLQPGPQTAQSPTGTDPEAALTPVLPPTYTLNTVQGGLTQRPGASLSLTSAFGTLSAPGKTARSAVVSGGITIGTGAAITVDPLQSVTLSSPSEIVVDGRITAPSGTISVLNTSANRPYAPGLSSLSVWIGGTATLDASARPVTGTVSTGSAGGRPFGIVPQGGSIVIGAPTSPQAFEDGVASTDAFIFVRPGATLTAAGASAAIDVGQTLQNSLPPALLGQGQAGTGAVPVASNGGTISFSSYNGIYLDGTIAAPAGGASAAGGTLGVEMDLPALPRPDQSQISIPQWFFEPRRIVVSTDAPPDTVPAGLSPGDGSFVRQQGLVGQAAVSQSLVATGGFDTLFLLARDQIVFDPADTAGVSLSLGQSATLAAFAFSDATKAGNVAISAPYVALSGAPNLTVEKSTSIIPGLNEAGAVASFSQRYQPCLSGAGNCASGTFTVTADQIDLSRSVRFGVSGSTPASATGTTTRTIDQPGFDAVDLLSSGDIRFVPPASGLADVTKSTDAVNKLTLADASLVTTGDLTLSAARVYPATGVSALLAAGFVSGDTPRGKDPSTGYYADSTLVFATGTDAAQQTPLSVFGQLQVYGETIEQGGNVSAPLGSIDLGLRPLITPPGLPAGAVPTPAAQVLLLPGSVTSVSAAGATIPFGGTTDGLTYGYDGQVLAFSPAVYGADPAFGQQSIGLAAARVQADAGAVLDLRGGGTLTGGGGEILGSGGAFQSQGFIAGRGGSTDVLTTPLLAITPSGGAVQAQPTVQQDPIFAILPGLQGGYAPTTLLDASAVSYAGSVPLPGEQVTIGAGVPGLAAGTYTLLPSYYALLPGGYRVQLGGATGSASVLGAQPSVDGSFALTGTLGFANTGRTSAQPVSLTVTSGATVRTYAQYDEQDYAQTAAASAAVLSKPRPYLPQDAGQIDLQFLLAKRPAAGIPLDFAGTALLSAAPGGYDGDVIVQQGAAPIEILGQGAPTKGYVSLPASSLDAFGAPLLLVGGDFTSNLGFTTLNNPGADNSVTLRSGATLTAGAVWLFGTGTGGVSVEQGAAISTLGQAPNLPDSRSGAVFSVTDDGTGPSEAAVVVAGGSYTILPGAPGTATVTLGGCAVGGSCSGSTSLASSGLVAVFAGGAVTEAGPAAFAAPELMLGAPSINLTPDAFAGSAPAGITLSQSALTGLLAGSPGLASLDLIASQSVNLYGSLQFGRAPGTGAPLQLVLDTPAIYGAGAAGSTATLAADTIVWANSAGAPAPILPGGPGTGSGALTLDARDLVIGAAPVSQPQDQTTIARTAIGFSDVTLIGTKEVTGNTHAALSVYQAQGAYGTATLGSAGIGGALSIDTPLLTAAPGGILSLAAGAGVTVAGAPGAPASTTAGGLGGEIDVDAPTIALSTRVALPSGKLVLNATGDITLGAGSVLDLTGPALGFFDVTRGSWGGTVQLTSSQGSITQEAGGVIDVSAQMAQGGTLSATALSGAVTLDGTLAGGAPAGYGGGSIDLRGASLAGPAGSMTVPAAFMAFNDALNQGGFTLARGFELAGPGSLTLPAGGTITAQTTAIAVDRGSLDIEGTIDASGPNPGTIRLAGAGGLTLGGGSVLAAQGTVEQCASGPCSAVAGQAQDQPVDALNAAQIELTVPASVSADGVHFAPNTAGLTIAPGATIDIASPDPTADARIEIDVPRTAAASGDANISAAGPVSILGATRASSIDVNAFWAYAPDSAPFLAGGVLTQAAFGSAASPGPIAADAQAFIGQALATGLVTGKLAGLSAYAQAFHLRPGVEIDGSADVAGGNLTVLGDIDLSGLRFAGVNPNTPLSAAVYGSGEPGVLWLRAPGTLDVLGSINDGFAPPPATPDDQGWVLHPGRVPAGQSVILPVQVTLGPGTVFPKTATLTYAIPLAASTLAAGSVAPTQLVLAASNAQAFSSNVQIGRFAPGKTIPAGALQPGTIIPAGAFLPVKIDFAAVTWPAGAPLSLLSTPATLDPDAPPLTLAMGDLIPAGSEVKFIKANGNPAVNVYTRPGGLGQVWGVSQMLPAGDLSWSLRLVGGAELAGADSRSVQDALSLSQQASAADPAPGSIALSDLHVPNTKTALKTVDFSVLRTGTGTLDLLAGGDVSEATPFGIYTAGTQSSGVTAAYDQSRVGVSGTILGGRGNIALDGASYNTADAATYQANYPANGGNLLVAAGGTVTGDVYELSATGAAQTAAGTNPPAYSNDVSNWLWWQGGGSVPAAWWVNFGTFATIINNDGTRVPALVGFTGYGALGGGNASVQAGAAAGQIAPLRSVGSSTALDIAVASTGRFDPATQTTSLTGGGNLIAAVGGALNAGSPLADATLSGNFIADSLSGVITNTRGPVFVGAASIGQVQLTYNDISQLSPVNDANSGVLIDPRADNPLVSKTFDVGGGPVIVEGDTQASFQTRGDLALSAAGNPTFGYQVQSPASSSDFSLWQSSTSILLASAGGNIVPATPYGVSLGVNDAVTQSNSGNNTALLLYPPSLDVRAESGSIFVQQDSANTNPIGGLELAPAPKGQLEFLAGQSIYDVGNASPVFLQASVDISGASVAAGSIPTPGDPDTTKRQSVNSIDGGVDTGVGYFADEPDVATGLLHVGDTDPARFYAVSGDVIGLQTGGLTFSDSTGQQVGDIAAKAVQIKAGNDVLSLGVSQQLASIFAVPASGIFLNNNASDVSAIEAGRDIFFASALVAGPGLLIEQAGGNIYQGDQGFLESVGQTGLALTPATRNSGAGITVLAGLGSGINEAGFAALYLDPANLADPNTPLQDQPGRVERTYQTQLLSFLQQRGYAGPASGAFAAFQALPPDQQTAFLLSVYFAELNQSGLDYNTPSSRFYHSYIEGEQAIRTLFPNTDPTGVSAPSGGGLTAFSGTVFDLNGAPQTVDGGIRTDFGGAITTVVPYGVTLLGNYGITPGPLSGIVTQGSGDIDSYSYGSVTLGQSRILTTFGGDILIWMSSDGEINAGRGSSSTVLAPPLSVSYDQFGNALLSPTVPSSGAGIGTLAPIPSVPAGDLNLIAPFGTIDAGEAGIRASGNANIAALVVLNAANIAVGGKTVGIPTVASTSTSAAAAASAAAGASTNAAQQTTPRAAPVQEPSVVEVEVVSITGGQTPDQIRKKRGI